MRVRLRLTRWAAGKGTGPCLSVDADDVVAIEETDYDCGGIGGSRWRTLLHLRGGTTVIADDDFREVDSALNRIRHTETVTIDIVTRPPMPSPPPR